MYKNLLDFPDQLNLLRNHFIKISSHNNDKIFTYPSSNFDIKGINMSVSSGYIDGRFMLSKDKTRVKLIFRCYHGEFLKRRYVDFIVKDNNVSIKILTDHEPTLLFKYEYDNSNELKCYQDSFGNWFDSDFFSDFIFDPIEISTRTHFLPLTIFKEPFENRWSVIKDENIIKFIYKFAATDDNAFELCQQLEKNNQKSFLLNNK